MSPSLDWLVRLCLASLASPKHLGYVPYARSGVVPVAVAAAGETSHAETRFAKPSQAIRSRDGLVALAVCMMVDPDGTVIGTRHV